MTTRRAAELQPGDIVDICGDLRPVERVEPQGDHVIVYWARGTGSLIPADTEMRVVA